MLRPGFDFRSKPRAIIMITIESLIYTFFIFSIFSWKHSGPKFDEWEIFLVLIWPSTRRKGTANLDVHTWPNKPDSVAMRFKAHEKKHENEDQREKRIERNWVFEYWLNYWHILISAQVKVKMSKCKVKKSVTKIKFKFKVNFYVIVGNRY